MKDDQLCSPKYYDQRGLCIKTDFVPRKQKLAYDKLHEFRESLKHLPVPAPLLPFAPRA